jgi:isoleucyl-tRNA synthetase
VDQSALISVHHCPWPEVDETLINEELVEEMDLVLKLVSLGHAARNRSGRKVRQPLGEAAFAVGSFEEGRIVDKYRALIMDELNVKEVRLLDTGAEAVHYQLKPLPKQLGQKYGSDFPGVREALLALDQESAAEVLLDSRPIQVRVEGKEYEILPSEVDVILEAHAGFSAVGEGPYIAALVTELTEALEMEGLAREVVRRVQDLRKDADLNVDERILIQYEGSDRVRQAIGEHRSYIMEETLASELERSESPQGAAQSKHAFDGQELEIALSRA